MPNEMLSNRNDA